MGALLVEAALQAGIRYETVVWPRVERVLATYPEAETTSAFQRVLMIVGATHLLDWALDRKINTLVDVVQFFVAEEIERVDDLRAWLVIPGNSERLKEINGIGNRS